MSPDWIVYLCLLLGLSAALVAGGLQVFSEFIMPALRQTEAQGAIEAMQNINRTIFRTVFISSFLALAPVSLIFGIYAWFSLTGQPQRLIIFAAVIYISTVFLATAVGNVPMNRRLERLPFDSAAARTYWPEYARVWTRWNSIRTIGAFTTAGCYLLAAVST